MVVATAITGGMVSVVLAAEQPNVEQQTAQAAPPPAAANGPVEELVVTGERNRSKLQEVAAPVAEVTGAALEDAHIDSVLSLGAIVPSADFHAYNANNVVLQVRGLGAAAVSGGQLGQVGVYVDNMYQGRQNALVYAMHDLETVDLQPGPQSTTNGANALAGLLTINSAKPSFTPGAVASVTLGDFAAKRPEDFGTKQFWGAVTGPVSADDAVRLTAYSDREDGWIRNTRTDITADDSATQGGRFQNLVKKDDVTLLFLGSYDNVGQHAGQSFFQSNEIKTSAIYATPAAAYAKFPALQALVNQGLLTTAQAQKFNTLTFGQQVADISSLLSVPNYVLPTNPNSTDQNHNQNFAGHTSRLSLKGDWEIDDHTTLTSITAWQNYLIWPNNDGDWTALNIDNQSGSHNWSTQRSEELRVDSKNNRLVDWTAGAFYFHQRNNQISDTQYGSDYAVLTAEPTLSNAGKALWLAKGVNGIASEAQAWTESETDALFGQGTLHLDSQWSLVAGLRDTWDHRNLNANVTALNLAGYSASDAASILNTQFIQNQGGAVQSNNLGGTAGVNYKPDKDILLFTSINRGYLPAGTQTGTLSTSAVAVGASEGIGEEKIIDGELGAKTKWLDDRLTANLTLYRGTLFNYQTTIAAINPVNGSSSSYIANVKAINTKGAEYTGSYKVNSFLKLGTASSFNLANYQSFRNSPAAPESTCKVCDLTGSRVQTAPHWTTNLWGEVTEPVADNTEVYFRTEYNHKSGSFIQANNTAQSWQGAYGLVNGQIGTRLNDGDIDLSVWVHNLFNVQYMTYQTTGNGVNWAIMSDPVSAGFTMTARF